MPKNIEKIAAGLGATMVCKVPNTGGGAFGAARLGRIVATIQARLVPGHAVEIEGAPLSETISRERR
jgi:hypothetical protein